MVRVCRSRRARQRGVTSATLGRILLLAFATTTWPAIGADSMQGGLLPVPAVTIDRGATVTSAMLTERHFYYDPDRPLAVLTDPSVAIGKAARRTLVAGKPIPLNAFRTVPTVIRGRLTEARLAAGNLSIIATVIPQADAAIGEFVQAKNVETGRIVSGIVAADGSIEVPTR